MNSGRINYNEPLGVVFGKRPDARIFQDDATLPLSNKFIGIEIEAENIPIELTELAKELYYWDITTDGSLRNFGAEFISRKLRGKDITLAIQELNKCLLKNNIEPIYSDRTS